jgi:hypothetical protein
MLSPTPRPLSRTDQLTVLGSLHTFTPAGCTDLVALSKSGMLLVLLRPRRLLFHALRTTRCNAEAFCHCSA